MYAYSDFNSYSSKNAYVLRVSESVREFASVLFVISIFNN